MAFIWNDEEIQFVKPNKDWDKNEFVIVHTLYVQLNEKEEEKEETVEELTKENLSEKFSKYGPIEKVEIFTHKNTNDNNKKYAYVQFRENKHAFLAYLDTQRKNKPYLAPAFTVIPADTWRQPSPITKTNMEIDDDDDFNTDVEMKTTETTIDNLNDDCLVKISTFCDRDSLIAFSEVNKNINGVMHRDVFPRFPKFVLNLDRGPDFRERTDMTLRKMCKVLRVYGPYIKEVEMCFHNNVKPANLVRIFDKFAKYVGPALKKMIIHELTLHDVHVNALKSALKNLEILKISSLNGDYDVDVDFRTFCPNLKKFKLQQNMQFVFCAEPWPSLEELSIVNNEFMQTETGKLLMENNPQLKRFKFTAYVCDVAMENVGNYLPNLEKLTAYQGFPDISEKNLVHLTGLKNLTTLELMYIDSPVFNDILGFLPQLPGLQKLKLHLFSISASNEQNLQYLPNFELLIALAQELHELKAFHIAFCQLTSEVLLHFIRFAEKLEEFCMHSCDLPLSGKLLFDISDVRKLTKTLYDQRLKLIVDPFDDDGVQEVLRVPMVGKYITVETCNSCKLVRCV